MASRAQIRTPVSFFSTVKKVSSSLMKEFEDLRSATAPLRFSILLHT
jgi:hypothetical protein